MTPIYFLDTNVILRHILGDHDEHSPKADLLFAEIERGELEVRSTDTVIFEAIFSLQRFFRVPRVEIAESLLPILKLPGFMLPGKHSYADAFELWTNNQGLSFADCFHIVTAIRLGIPDFIAFDRRIGSVPGINRLEPPINV